MKQLFPLTGLVLAISAYAGANTPPPHLYSETGLKVAHKIGSDLYDSLDEKYQKQITPDAIRLETLDAPVITPVLTADQNKKLNQVFVSAGYVDLMNCIAHAKAIDRIEPGYFAQYATILADYKGSGPPPALPNMSDRYWSREVMNDQASYFNQMLGMTMAINLSHHYLGHYNKYAGQMLGGKLLPINEFLTLDEWEASVRLATLNALNCALGTEGAKVLFDEIDKMPKRPAWTTFIVPQGVDLKKVNQELVAYEVSYFHGGLK